MATAAAAKGPKELTFTWEGKDKGGKVVRGEMRAQGEALVNATLRRQGIVVTKVKRQRVGRGGSVGEKDIALFTVGSDFPSATMTVCSGATTATYRETMSREQATAKINFFMRSSFRPDARQGHFCRRA